MNHREVLVGFFLLFEFFGVLYGAEVNHEQYIVPEKHVAQFDHSHEKFDKYRRALLGLKLTVLIDRSASMLSQDPYAFHNITNAIPPSRFVNPHNQEPYWKRMDSAFLIASHLASTIFNRDADGAMPIYFFGSLVDRILIKNTEQLFWSFGQFPPDENQSTNLYDALEQAFEENIHVEKKTFKGMMKKKTKKEDKEHDKENVLFLVITDGKPNGSEKAIKELIEKKVSQKDPKGNHLNILFVRIGDDANAKNFLNNLDLSKKIGKNVVTKTDDWIYAHLPEQVLYEAIFEDQDD